MARDILDGRYDRTVRSSNACPSKSTTCHTPRLTPECFRRHLHPVSYRTHPAASKTRWRVGRRLYLPDPEMLAPVGCTSHDPVIPLAISAVGITVVPP